MAGYGRSAMCSVCTMEISPAGHGDSGCPRWTCTEDYWTRKRHVTCKLCGYVEALKRFTSDRFLEGFDQRLRFHINFACTGTTAGLPLQRTLTTPTKFRLGELLGADSSGADLSARGRFTLTFVIIWVFSTFYFWSTKSIPTLFFQGKFALPFGTNREML